MSAALRRSLIASACVLAFTAGDLRRVSLAIGTSAEAASVSPYSDSEIRAVETGDEAKIRELRNEEVTQLRIALGRRQAKNRMAELYFRLAELYLEAYHQTFLQEGRVHERRLAHGEPSPTIDRSHSKPYLSLGLKASKDLIANGVPYEHADQVYYFLGFNYGELGDKKESIRYFTELVHRYPNSPFAAEGYRELGDDAYDALKFHDAQGYYLAAIPKATQETAPRLYHKLAWAYYRTKNFDRAIASMKTAIDLSQKSGEKFLSLHDEALRDMALFMTESGRVDEAIAYFRENVSDPNYYGRVLEKLGKQYERNVEPAKATQVYESLLKTNPESEAAFRVLVKLVDLDLRRQLFPKALERVRGARLPTSLKEDDTRVALQNLRAMVRRTATEHHEKFRKKADRTALATAEAWYKLYLTKFLAQDDSHKEKPEIQMYLAEIERELGNSREASDLYRAVVDAGDQRYAKEAAALWTASLAEAVKKSGAIQAKNATDPSPLEKDYVQAADDLQANLGNTVEGREAALKAAQILAGYPNTRGDAIKRIKKIIEKSPTSAQANTGARLWLQLEVEKPNNDSDIKDTVQDLRGNAALMGADNETSKGKLHAALADQDTRVKIAIIAHDEKDKDYIAAAKGYEAFAQESKDQDTCEKALANANGAYLKAGDYVSVERVLDSWLKRFPRSAKASESFKASATHALIEGKYDVSARLFEKLGTDTSDADSLETAARVFEAIGDIPHAQADYIAHAQVHKTSPHRGAILLKIARMYEDQKMDREAVQTYRECMAISDEWEAQCGFYLAEHQFRLKTNDEAFATLRKIAAQGGGATAAVGAGPSGSGTHKGKAAPARAPRVAETSSGNWSPFVGYARFRLADLLEQSQRFDALELPDTKLKAAINQRVSFLEPLSRAYDSAVQAGGPWAIAALDRLARWAANFADDVDHISPPAGLDASSIAQFHVKLAQLSGPLRKKAQDSWLDAYRKAVAAEALSPALPEMADHLADLGTPLPARAQGARGGFRLAGIPADGGKDGAETAMQKVREKLLKNPQDAASWADYGNLIGGAGRPLLARIAYERALGLDPRSTAALNNRAVSLLSESGPNAGEENWLTAAEASSWLQSALKIDEFSVPAKLNRARLLAYYRIFEKSKALADQLLVRNDLPEAHDTLGVALQGMGEPGRAVPEFDKATDEGLKSKRFSVLFHKAARAGLKSDRDSQKDCLSALEDIDAKEVDGFERLAIDDLKRSCTQWLSKNAK